MSGQNTILASMASKGLTPIMVMLMITSVAIAGVGTAAAQTGTQLATTADSASTSDPLNQSLSASESGYEITEVYVTGVTYDVTTQGGTVDLTITATDESGNVVGETTVSGSGSDSAQDYTLELDDGIESPETISLSKSTSGGSATADTAELYGTATTGSIDVNATDADGNAVGSANVEIVDSSDSVVASGTTDSSGLYIASGLSEGDYTINVTHADYQSASQTATITAGSTTTASVSLADATTGDMEFEALDADGNAIEGATVELLDSDGAVVDSMSTDASGIALFEGVEQGDYDYSISHADYYEASGTVTVTAGESTTESATLDTIEYGDSEITVEDDGEAVEGATVELYEPDAADDADPVATADTDADGLATFSDIETGDYDVVVTHADHDDINDSVTINADETATLSLDYTDAGSGVSGTGDDGVDTEVIMLVAAVIVIVGAITSLFALAARD